MKNGKDKVTEKDVYDKLEEMDNKLERIKSDTHNLSRIASLSNTTIIVNELKKQIGKSKIRAAIVHLTKEEIGASELARSLGINGANLRMYMKPLLGNKGYIAEIKKGRERFFQRAELIDLIGFESHEDFAPLIESWKEDRNQEVDE